MWLSLKIPKFPILFFFLGIPKKKTQNLVRPFYKWSNPPNSLLVIGKKIQALKDEGIYNQFQLVTTVNVVQEVQGWKHVLHSIHQFVYLFLRMIGHLVTGGGPKSTIHLLWFWKSRVRRKWLSPSSFWRHCPSFSHTLNRLMHIQTRMGPGVIQKGCCYLTINNIGAKKIYSPLCLFVFFSPLSLTSPFTDSVFYFLFPLDHAFLWISLPSSFLLCPVATGCLAGSPDLCARLVFITAPKSASASLTTWGLGGIKQSQADQRQNQQMSPAFVAHQQGKRDEETTVEYLRICVLCSDPKVDGTAEANPTTSIQKN